MVSTLLQSIINKESILTESLISDDDFEQLQDPRNITGIHTDQHESYKHAISGLDRSNKYHNIIAQRILSGN